MSDLSVPYVSTSHKSHPFLDLLDRPIAFHRVFVTLTGSVDAGLMLSQAFYWSRRTQDPDGWFYKTQAEWEEETALKRHEQERARKALRDTTFWQEKRRGLPAKLYFRVDLDKLERALRQLPAPRPLRGKNRQQNHQSAGSQQTSLPSVDRLDRDDLADQFADIPQTITETTTERTSEISSNVEANVAKDRTQPKRQIQLTPRQQLLVEEVENQFDTHSRGPFCTIVSDRGLGEEVTYRLMRETLELEDAGRIKTSASQCFMDLCQREAQRQGIDLGFRRT